MGLEADTMVGGDDIAEGVDAFWRRAERRGVEGDEAMGRCYNMKVYRQMRNQL